MMWMFWRRRRRDDALDCGQVARVLQSYLDDELTVTTAREVADHLEQCRRCGMEADTYRDLKQRLSRFADPVDQVAVERLRRFVDELAGHRAP